MIISRGIYVDLLLSAFLFAHSKQSTVPLIFFLTHTKPERTGEEKKQHSFLCTHYSLSLWSDQTCCILFSVLSFVWSSVYLPVLKHKREKKENFASRLIAQDENCISEISRNCKFFACDAKQINLIYREKRKGNYCKHSKTRKTNAKIYSSVSLKRFFRFINWSLYSSVFCDRLSVLLNVYKTFISINLIA